MKKIKVVIVVKCNIIFIVYVIISVWVFFFLDCYGQGVRQEGVVEMFILVLFVVKVMLDLDLFFFDIDIFFFVFRIFCVVVYFVYYVVCVDD